MERLKDKILTKIPAEKENTNKKFTRDVHFQIVSDIIHIKDHFFFSKQNRDSSDPKAGGMTERSRQSNQMEFEGNLLSNRDEQFQSQVGAGKTSIIETFI